MTTENSAFCLFLLIELCVSVVLVTLTATCPSFIVDIECETSRPTVSATFPTGVTVAVVFHSEGWSTKAVTVFVNLVGIVRGSSAKTVWGFALNSEVVFTCIVRCGLFMRPCVVAMTILFFFRKCNPLIGCVSFFFTTNCSAKVLSRVSNLSVVVANVFSN